MSDKNTDWRAKYRAMMTDPDFAAKAVAAVDNTRKVNTNLMNKSEEFGNSLSLDKPISKPLDLSRVQEMQTEQAARATMPDDDSGVADLAVQAYADARKQIGDEVSKQMAEDKSMAFVHPAAAGILRSAESMKAGDVQKTFDRMLENNAVRQAIETKANKELTAALGKNPALTEEQQKDIYNKSVQRQIDAISGRVNQYLLDVNAPKSEGEYVLKSAVGNSLIGKSMLQAARNISGVESAEFDYAQQALADYDANKASWYGKGGAAIGGLLLDAPMMQGIGSASSAVLGRGTSMALGKAASNTLWGKMLIGQATAAGTLGGYNFTSTLASQMMGGRFDAGELFGSTLHGVGLGAATGGMTPLLRGATAGMGAVGKTATMGGGILGEAAAFSAPEWVETFNENPYDFKAYAEALGTNVMVIAGLKASNLPKTVQEYKEWWNQGKTSSFTDADYKALSDYALAKGYANDGAFTYQDGVYQRSMADRATGGRNILTMTKLEGGKERNLAMEMYQDPNVPLSMKTKIAAKMGLPAPNPVLPNAVEARDNVVNTYYEYREQMSDGTYVTRRILVDSKEMPSKRKARAAASEFGRTKARQNSIIQSEAEANTDATNAIVMARLTEQAWRSGTNVSDEVARMYDIAQRAQRGEASAEDIAYYQSVMEGTTEVTDRIKADIKAKTGVDIDEVLKQEGTFNTAQDKALTMYSEALASLKDNNKPTTERGTTASQASIADYIELKGMGIEQTRQLLNDPTAKVAAEKEIRNKYALWLKYFDGQMSEEQLASRLGYDLDSTKGLMDFVNEEAFFRGKAANRIAYNAANAAKRLLEQGSGGVRFTEDGKVKLQGVPYAISVDESIVDRYRAAQQGSGENYQRIANDALKDIIRQSEQPIEEMLQQMATDEQPIDAEPQTEQEAVTQQMVDNRLAEIDTDLQGIEADGVQRMTINDKPVAIIKGRIVADENGQVDKTKSSAEVAYMLLDENGRPMLNEQGKPIIEIGVKPSNVRVENIETWRSVDDYKASEERRIRENNRITDEAMRQVDEQTEVENQVPTEPKTADDLLAMCDGDKALALDVATDELAKAMQAKGKGATPAETIEINKRIRMYQQMVDRLSATEQPDAATLPEAEQTAAKAEPQVTEDMEFIYQGLDENHEGMEPMQTADGRYKWVGLQRGELTATMGERDVELLDGLAKKLGVAVIPINVADSAVNGYYRDGNIYVNTNRGAEWTMRWVAGHELLHDVAKKSPEAYDAYKQAVLDMWGEDYIKSQVKQIIEDYKASGKEIDREQALTELVNDFGGELFSSRDGLKILDNILKDESRKGNTGFVNTIKQWWERLKEFFGVTPYASEVEKKLADAYKEAIANAEKFGKNFDAENNIVRNLKERPAEVTNDDLIANEGAEMSIVRDRNKIEELEGEELVPMLRTFQVFDGRLYPPMAAVQGGKKVHSVMVGDWWKSDENADLAQVKVKGSSTEFYDKDDDRISKKDGKWVITIDGEDRPLATNGNSLSYYFNLKKGEKGDVVTDDLYAAYNPYIHASRSALNDQFKGAYLRPNLALVEVLVPKSELDGTNRYKADYAKDGIGEVDWNSGTVIKQAVAAGHPGRKVALSRYAKIGKVFTNAEWADRIDEELAPYKDKITLPFISFPPEVLRGLANKGYKIEPPTSKKAQPYYEAWLKGEEPTNPNGGGEPTEEFSIKADKELEKKSLVGVHNLTEDNLRYALNLGGLANPSTAVIDKNIMGLEGFGDISLIMPKSLVAKSTGKNVGTFAGDAYTPRFPRGSIVKYMTRDGEKVVMKDYPGKDKFSQDFRSAIYELGNEYGSGVTPTLYYMYKLENGGAKIVKAEAPKIKSKEHQRMIDKFGNKEWYELNDAEKRELVDYRKSEMIESLKGADKNMVDKVVNDFINSAEPEDLAYKKLRMLKMDYKEQQKAGEIDYMATYRNAQDDVALAGEQAKFNKWLADKSKRYGIEDRIFRGYTSSGNRKYAPMTLANISKVMKEQGRAGAETFMTKSAYSLRGKMLPVYKTLEQIKKNKSKLADTETYEKFRKEIGDEYNELILDISELPNVKYDDTHYILEDALLKGFDYAEKQAGVQISDAVRERISAFGNLLKEAPVKYFETKFERPVMFNEFVAAIVPKDINPELRKALTDNGLAIEEYDRGDEASRLEAIRKASDRDDVQFSVKGKRADESVLDYAKRMSEETGKKNLLNGGSYFSGGGLLEEGLKGIVNPTIAVEFNQKVAGVYRNNFGEHIVTADVRNVDPASLVKNIDGPVAYFHASPVCKNFSNAKRNAEELPLDKETAQSTAKFIGEVRPKIVTIENVKGYRNSDAMKIILDELEKQGYNYDVDVYNAADYGAYTSRERLIVRAVRDWPLPPKPIKMLADERPSGWFEAVADIIDELPQAKNGVADWMDTRLKAMGIDYRNIDKPLYIFGSGYAKDKIGHAFADELVPTLRTKGGDIIVMPDGRVLKATPRVLARISGMSDEYEMPKTDDLAHTIVGNGIPVQLTKAVMGSLIENVKSDLDAGNTEYSIIGKRGAANLDKRDETSIRVDNMITAEEMEKAGKDAKTIRMATGWERGADGKWRYEVKDLSMLPAEQWIGKRNKKLSDIVENADELFAAYPELANVKIKEGNGKTYGGMYSDGTITLDTYLAKLWMKRLPDSLPRANKFMNETLIHEIQHYIQEKEGFAAGGNEGMILNKDAISEIDALISDSNKLAVQYNDMIAKGVYEGREEIKEKIISLRAEANAIKKKNVIGAEGYRSLAGEVEARNAEFRSNMTDKERANTMLADTEDVGRDEQIVYGNTDDEYSIKIRGKEYRNDGYTQREDGTNVSIRALDAEEDGTHSKGNFIKAYKVAKKDFDLLASLGVIKNTEWHHTGTNFAKTDYYSWADSKKADGDVEYGELAEIDPNSMAEIYKTNKKEIGQLTDEYNNAKWGSLVKEREKLPTIEYITERYIRVSNPEKYSLSDWLTKEEKNSKSAEHEEISRGGEAYGTSYERRQMHEGIDYKYDKIAYDRKKEWAESHKDDIRRKYDEITARVEKYNAEILPLEDVFANDAKGKPLIKLLEMFGYSAEDAAKKIYHLQYQYYSDTIDERMAEASEKVRKEYDAKIESARGDFDKWLSKAVKDGKAEFIERVATKPEYFITTKEEMNGRYGWFEASSRYNLPRYYSGYKFKTKRMYDSYKKREEDIFKIELEQISKTQEASNNVYSEYLKASHAVREDLVEKPLVQGDYSIKGGKSGLKGVNSDAYKRIIELAGTYYKEAAENENNPEWKDNYFDYEKQVKPLAETLTDEALDKLYNELEERFDSGIMIVGIMKGREAMYMRKRVDEQTKSNEKTVSKVKVELDALKEAVKSGNKSAIKKSKEALTEAVIKHGLGHKYMREQIYLLKQAKRTDANYARNKAAADALEDAAAIIEAELNNAIEKAGLKGVSLSPEGFGFRLSAEQGSKFREAVEKLDNDERWFVEINESTGGLPDDLPQLTMNNIDEYVARVKDVLGVTIENPKDSIERAGKVSKEEKTENYKQEQTEQERAEYEAKEQWRKDNAGAIASSFFADRRADKAAEVERLKKKISELKADNTKAASEDKAKVIEIADEMHKYIKQNISTENQGDMTRQQFESVLKQLETAVAKQDLEKPMQAVEYIGTNVTRRSLTRQMREFLKSEFKSMTPQGAVKAKTVDGATSRVLELAKTMYATMNKLPLGGEVAALQKQMRDLKADATEWATDQSADTKNLLADVLKVTERPAATRYSELAELRDKVAADGSTSGEMLGYIDHMLDIMGDIDYFRGEQQKAKEASALNSKEDLETLKSELLDKSDKGILSEEDKAVLDNMPLYEMMVNLRQQQLDIDGGGAASIDAQIRNKQNAIKAYRAKMNELPKTNTTGRERYKKLIEQVEGEIDDLFASRIIDQKAVNNGMRELIDDLVTLKEQGHSRLVEWSKGKQERSNGIRKLANDSFSSTARGYWDEVNKKGHRLRDINNFLNNAKLTMISPALSFEYMLGTLDKKYYTNDSPIYNRFIKSQDGLLKANDNFFEGLEAYNKEVNAAANRLIGRGAITDIAEWFKLGDRFATEEIPFAFEVDQMFDDGTVRKVTKGITATMTRGQAAKIYAWSRMTDGLAKLKAHGVTDETIATVKDFIGEGYMNFVDWVEDDFFPRLRREKYNPKYKEIYGISMAENEHYFPFAIYKKDVRTNTDLEQIGDDKLGGGLVGNLIERKRNNARLDFTRNSPDIFDMITRYGETMEEWTAYAQVREDLKAMVNDKRFKVKCDMFGTDYYKHFLEAARVASRTSDDKALAGKWNTSMSKLQKVLASSAISMRVSTALKQLLSAPAFAVYSLDPKFLHQLEKTVVPIDIESAIKGLLKIGSGDLAEAKKLLLSENWVGHYNWCVNNLPSFRERVSLGGAGNPILEEKGFGKFCDAVQSVGMIPNRLVDAFTCSMGAKAIYEYNFNKYKKMYGEKAAHNMAVTEAEIAFNSSQQSSNPVFLSPMQVTKQFFVRGLMNFKNSPIGYLRAGMKANTDIVRAIKSIYNPTFKVDGQEMRFNSNGKNAASMLMTAAARSAMYNFFLNFIWNLGTVGIAGLSYTAMRNLSGKGNEDGNLLYTDEEWKKAEGDNLAGTLFLCATQGLPYISGPFATAEQGTEFAPLMLLNTLNEMGTDIYQSGLVSPVTAQWITNIALKNAIGIDPQVCAQVYEGLQGILADRPVTEEDIMNLLASPRSAISGMTKQKVGEYDRMRDYVDARIKSSREIGIDERMDFGKALAGKRELRKSNLDYYIDEYLEANIPGYREISGRKSKETKQEEQANKKLYEQSMSLVEKVVGTPKGEADEQKASKIDSEDYDTKYKVRRLRDAVAAIHKLYAAGDYGTAEDIAAEMQRRIERGYDPNGKTLDERLKNVDIWTPTVEVAQRTADGYSTNFDRAIGGEFKKMYVGKMNGEEN